MNYKYTETSHQCIQEPKIQENQAGTMPLEPIIFLDLAAKLQNQSSVESKKELEKFYALTIFKVKLRKHSHREANR